MVAQSDLNERVQGKFRVMLGDYLATGSWSDELVREYEEGERELDLEWERAKADFDAMQDADHDYHVNEAVTFDDCADCRVLRASRIPEAESRALWGDR